VLEVSRNKLQDLGIRYPTQLSAGLIPPGSDPVTATGGIVSLDQWRNRDDSMVRLTITDPAVVLNLKAQDGNTNLLANPRIRVKNKEKAKVHIGERVPVITTTAAVSGGFVSSNVSYLDVGLKLEVEPQIFVEEEVGIKVGLEVSNIVSEVRVRGSLGSTDTIAYQIGTRNASTLLRLADGETQVLAGLITDADRQTTDKVPGLGDLPLLGRLFSSQKDEKQKSEIVLLITPRVVRGLARPDAAVTEFLSGTEGSVGAAGPVRGAAGVQPASPAAPGPPGAAPAVPDAETMVPIPALAPEGLPPGAAPQPAPAAPAGTPGTGIFRRAPVVIPAPVTGSPPAQGGN
jgi:general secretion pathway protein D